MPFGDCGGFGFGSWGLLVVGVGGQDSEVQHLNLLASKAAVGWCTCIRFVDQTPPPLGEAVFGDAPASEVNPLKAIEAANP